MKIGVVIPAAEVDGDGTTPGWPAIRSFVRAADSLDIDSVWMFDHFFNRTDDGRTEGMHEAWTIVSAVAAVTERVAVGQLVMCTSYRNPGLLAKMAVTADEVSGGRLVLGVGCGWHDPEYAAFDYPTDHRVSRFEESLQIIGPLLRGETVSFEGRFHRARDAVLAPPPARRIPILVAADGPRMMRLAARHADAWHSNGFGVPDERLLGLLGGLDEALAAERRDRGTLERTVGIDVRDPTATPPPQGDSSFAGSVDELARLLETYDDLGIAHVMAGLSPMTEGALERLAAARRLRSG